ncbi:MAG: VOC family protein, partial [Acidimicrobiales bacterium]
MPVLTDIHVADSTAVWAELGFAIDGATTDVDGIQIVLGLPGRGLVAWSFRGLSDEVATIDGIPIVPSSETRPQNERPSHPNGVTGLDHVVVATPDLPRTIDAMAALGLELRRVRDIGRDDSGVVRQQAFFWTGPVILEVVGPADATGDGPASLWGLALTAHLDTAAAYLGDRLRGRKPAVQEGREIATVDRRAGSTVSIALMSPHPG